MKELCNFCPHPGKELDPEKIKAIDGISGIELLVYEGLPDNRAYEPLVTGVHLAYWPDWLDFWLGKKGNDKYGNTDKWVLSIKENILSALKYRPEYLVWHVSSSTVEELFTMNYKYENSEIVKEAARVFNTVSTVIPDNVTVLFENLWHTGLTLTQPAIANLFFSLIEKKNVGIVLDTGHLMLTEQNLRFEAQGIEYIYRKVKELGGLKKLIKGVHLSNSLDSSRRDFSVPVPADISSKQIWQRLKKLDRHLPFSECSLGDLLEFISPEYLVHELLYTDFDQLTDFVQIQRNCCKKFLSE